MKRFICINYQSSLTLVQVCLSTSVSADILILPSSILKDDYHFRNAVSKKKKKNACRTSITITSVPKTLQRLMNAMCIVKNTTENLQTVVSITKALKISVTTFLMSTVIFYLTEPLHSQWCHLYVSPIKEFSNHSYSQVRIIGRTSILVKGWLGLRLINIIAAFQDYIKFFSLATNDGTAQKIFILSPDYCEDGFSNNNCHNPQNDQFI